MRHKIVINKNLKNSFLSPHLLYVIAVAAADLVAFFSYYKPTTTSSTIGIEIGDEEE